MYQQVQQQGRVLTERWVSHVKLHSEQQQQQRAPRYEPQHTAHVLELVITLKHRLVLVLLQQAHGACSWAFAVAIFRSYSRNMVVVLPPSIAQHRAWFSSMPNAV